MPVLCRLPFAPGILRLQFDDARAQRRDQFAVVRDHDDAYTVGTQAVDELHHLHPCAPVLSESRLVQNEHTRRGCQRRGHGEPAFLPTGKGVRIGVLIAQQIEPPQQGARTFAGLALLYAHTQRAEHHLVEYAAGGELVFGVLEHI